MAQQAFLCNAFEFHPKGMLLMQLGCCVSRTGCHVAELTATSSQIAASMKIRACWSHGQAAFMHHAQMTHGKVVRWQAGTNTQHS